MKIQLIASDGSDFLEPAAIGQNGEVVFPANNTGRDVEIGDARLITETDFERLFLTNFWWNCLNITNPCGTIVLSGDCVRLTVRLANNGSSNNFRNRPQPISFTRSCSNCEYFLCLNGTKICNGLQTPSANPSQPTECGHWQQIDRAERSRRDRELRRQVRNVEDVAESRSQNSHDRLLHRLMFYGERTLAAPRHFDPNPPRAFDEPLTTVCTSFNIETGEGTLTPILDPERGDRANSDNSSPQINIRAEDSASAMIEDLNAALEAIDLDALRPSSHFIPSERIAAALESLNLLPPRVLILPTVPNPGSWPQVTAAWLEHRIPPVEREEVIRFRENPHPDRRQIEAEWRERLGVGLRQILLSTGLPLELLRETNDE